MLLRRYSVALQACLNSRLVIRNTFKHSPLSSYHLYICMENSVINSAWQITNIFRTKAWNINERWCGVVLEEDCFHLKQCSFAYERSLPQKRGSCPMQEDPLRVWNINRTGEGLLSYWRGGRGGWKERPPSSKKTLIDNREGENRRSYCWCKWLGFRCFSIQILVSVCQGVAGPEGRVICTLFSCPLQNRVDTKG